jgi:hypothetical protein
VLALVPFALLTAVLYFVGRDALFGIKKDSLK